MPQLEQDYVFIPQRLIADLQANPAAIGVYALIARLFLIYQEPIPLSAADLQRYDPTLSYGAARGALQRLTALRWLHDQTGHKNQYTPTWGVIKGMASPWRMDASTLGRPAHVVTLRLDRRLLDVGLGKLIPHPTYPAQTKDRYLEQPILSLRDVGAYAQVLSGYTLAATPALWRYALIRDGIAQPLPDAAELISLASQRTLDGEGAAPTEHGCRVLGLGPSSAPPAPAPPKSLFFVDHALIPDPITCSIPDLIPMGMEFQQPSSAAEPVEAPGEMHSPRMAGTPEIFREISNSPPNPPTRPNGGGGNDLSSTKNEEPTRIQPETASAQLLRSIQAFPKSVEELGDLPAELVGRAIAYAQTEPGIESVPGWVVEALRRYRDEGWPIPEPRTRQIGITGRDRPIDIETYTSGAYGDLFRLGSDTSDLGDCFVEREAGAFIPPNADALEQAPEESHAQGQQFTAMDAAIAEAESPAECLLPESADDMLTSEVQAELRMRCGRQRGRVIEGLRVHVAGDTTLVICATFADLNIVQRELIGALQRILEALGAPSQLVFTTRAGLEARKRDAGNARSRLHQSHGMPGSPLAT
jgi:hypothetical protein